MQQIVPVRAPRKIRSILVLCGLGFLLLGIGIVFATGLGLIGSWKDLPPSKIVKASPPTADQIRVANNAVRADGTITAITDTEITLMLTGQKKQLTLRLINSTKYLHGLRGASAQKADIVLGQKVVVSYDLTDNVASSVWGSYDK